jgi:hypothetical protein
MRMRLLAFHLLLLFAASCCAQTSRAYLGFDRNDYPGDANLAALHKSFAYSGYWLNNPPSMNSNPWQGKRAVLRAQGFGFLLLFNGRLDRELRRRNAIAMGRADGEAAVAAARREGFPPEALIFLDQEEGGRLLSEQAAYLIAWIGAVKSSAYRAGIYCSGIAVPDGASTISTAQDVAARFPDLPLWIANDQCPPAPGCTLQANNPRRSGFPQAVVWQYAQSPRRAPYTAQCAQTYSPDQQCYAPGMPHSTQTFLDLNTASSPDPSAGR